MNKILIAVPLAVVSTGVFAYSQLIQKPVVQPKASITIHQDEAQTPVATDTVEQPIVAPEPVTPVIPTSAEASTPAPVTTTTAQPAPAVIAPVPLITPIVTLLSESKHFVDSDTLRSYYCDKTFSDGTTTSTFIGATAVHPQAYINLECN